MEEYVIKQNKKLRCGYTTGSCAAAAAKAAVEMLLSQKKTEVVSLMTPKGISLQLTVCEANFDKKKASCAIRKDSGDDPDVTNGILVFASAEKTEEPGIFIDGGTGVGRVTKKGLEQPIGKAAINKVPRSMIRMAVEEILSQSAASFGIKIIISIPEGMAIAKKTFNERLGIEGGISILGTSGIVEPMSEDAIKETIHLEIKMQKAARRDYILASPGNYGEEFADKVMHLKLDHAVKYSNYTGDLIDYLVMEECKGILIVGHIGKMIKTAGGIMNTHSKNADARLELLTANALMAGATTEQLKMIMNALTTEEAVCLLKEFGLLQKTMERLIERMEYYLYKRAFGKLKIGLVVFSNQLGLLGQNKEVEELLWYIS